MSERQPDPVEDDGEDRDGLGDPAASHGSDLDARIDRGQDRPADPADPGS
jgi:hypothetical protein